MASRADISAGEAFVRLYAKTTELASGLADAENLLKGFASRAAALLRTLAAFTPRNLLNKLSEAIADLGKKAAESLSSIGDGLQNVGKKAALTGTGILGSMLGVVTHFGVVGDELEEMSQRTGVSVEALSELGYGLRRTGADLSVLEVGLKHLQKTVSEAGNHSTSAAKDLEAVFLKAAQLDGLAGDKQLALIADGLAKIPDPGDRAAAAMAVFGDRVGTKLLPLLQNGSAGMREFQERARSLGLTISTFAAALGGKTIDALTDAKDSFLAFTFAIGESLAPMVKDAAEAVAELMGKLTAFIRENKELVQLAAKLAVGLLAMGAATTVAGIGFKIAGSALGIFVSMASKIVSTLNKVFGVIGIIALLVKAASFVGISFAMIAGAATSLAGVITGLLGAAIGVLGPTLMGIFWEILVPAVVIVGAITAAIAAMAVGAVAGAVAFWKLADPITALGPVLKAALAEFSNFASLLFKGDFQGAANAAIEGVKQVFLRGSIAIMQMIQNTLQRLPGFVASVLTGTAGVVSSVTATIQRAFAELWPAIQLSFTAFASFAQDIFDQLPKMAGYAFGRVIRATIEAMVKLQNWIVSTYLNIVNGIISALVSLGPKILKAMFTGNIKGLAEDFAKAMSVAIAANAGVVSGLFGGEVPDFKPSAGTVAAWQKVQDAVKDTHKEIAKGAGGKVGAGGVGSSNGLDADTVATFTNEWDPTPLGKYREELRKLLDVADAMTDGEFARALAQIKKETLGIEPTPLQQYRDRLLTLNEAMKDGVISSADWRAEVAKAQREILGVEPTKLQEFGDAVKRLGDQLHAGAFGYDEYLKRVEKARNEILGVDPTTMQGFADKVAELTMQMKAGAFGFDEYRKRVESARKEAYGLDPSAVDVFADRMTELRTLLANKQIIPTEFASEAKKAQEAFLGFDPTPIDTFTAKINELRLAMTKGLPKEAFDKAVKNALPPELQDIVEKTKSAEQKMADAKAKYQHDLAMLQTSGLDPEHFRRAEKDLQKRAASAMRGQVEISSGGTFSAKTAQGMGIGTSVDEKILQETVGQSELLRRLLFAAENGGKFLS